MTGLVEGALATWSAASYLYYHKAFQWLREWAQVYALREDGQPVTWLGRQLSCFWCVAFWVGLAFAPLALRCWQVLTPLALAGAAMLLAGGGRTVWRAMEDG